MICLTKLSGKKFIVNCEMIKFIESTPDTVITLTQGEKLMVIEDIDTVLKATVEYRQRLYQKLYQEGPHKNQSLINEASGI